MHGEWGTGRALPASSRPKLGRGRRSALIVGACALLAAAMAPAASADSGKRYIVVYEEGVAAAAKTDRLERREGFRASHQYGSALEGFAAELSDGQIGRIRQDPEVAFVSIDRTVQAVGPTATLQPGDSAPTGVRRIGAATTSLVQDAATSRVAVIDTGIDLSHPDLNSQHGTNCVLPGVTSNDDNGHGSHVAGTIGARNNGAGVVGVAPGTPVVSVKVLDALGSGLWSQVICGIDWVTSTRTDSDPGNDIAVANMSLGGSGSNDNACGTKNNDAMHKAICNSTAKGVTYVVAAGNDGADFKGSVPAAYPEALTVTAMSDSDGTSGGTGPVPSCRKGEKDDYYATFSNYAVASTEIDHAIAAPGVCIRSTWMLGGYNTISGTSMASPHVAGTAALCIGNGGTAGPCAGLAPADVIQKLRSDAAAAATSTNGFYGDPLRPVKVGPKRKQVTAYFGYLTSAGGY